MPDVACYVTKTMICIISFVQQAKYNYIGRVALLRLTFLYNVDGLNQTRNEHAILHKERLSRLAAKCEQYSFDCACVYFRLS